MIDPFTTIRRPTPEAEGVLWHVEQWPDAELVGEGLRVLEELARPSPTDILLATDLHAGNVLRSERQP